MVLEDLDGLGILTEPEARLYFAIERYLFPLNEMFRPENLAATEARYMKRTEPREPCSGPRSAFEDDVPTCPECGLDVEGPHPGH